MRKLTYISRVQIHFVKSLCELRTDRLRLDMKATANSMLALTAGSA